MGKAEWLLVIVVVALLVAPFVTLKAVSIFRRRGKLPPPQPYQNDDREE